MWRVREGCGVLGVDFADSLNNKRQPVLAHASCFPMIAWVTKCCRPVLWPTYLTLQRTRLRIATCHETQHDHNCDL